MENDWLAWAVSLALLPLISMAVGWGVLKGSTKAMEKKENKPFADTCHEAPATPPVSDSGTLVKTSAALKPGSLY